MLKKEVSDMKTKSIMVFRPGEKEPIWTHVSGDNEYVRVGYMQWGVVVDIAKSKTDIDICGSGATRKIFHGCSVVEDVERVE